MAGVPSGPSASFRTPCTPTLQQGQRSGGASLWPVGESVSTSDTNDKVPLRRCPSVIRFYQKLEVPSR